MDLGMHNTVIDSIIKDGTELMPDGENSRYLLGYDNPRDYLPKEIIVLLDDAFPPES